MSKDPYGGYGVMVARRNAARRAAKDAALADEEEHGWKPKKSKPIPKPLAAHPLASYEYRHTQDSIRWDDPSTDAAATELARRILDPTAPRMTMLVLPAGRGKTAICVKALALATSTRGELPFLVSAPRAVIDGHGWQETICSWNASHPDEALDPFAIETTDRVSAVLGDSRSRTNLLRDGFPRDGLLVLDEVQAYKNPTGRRAKALQKEPGMRIVGLTATPLTNDVLLDTGSYLIMAGKYRNKTDFVEENKLYLYMDQYGGLSLFVKDPDTGQHVLNEPLFRRYEQIRAELSDVIYQPAFDVESDMPDETDTVVQLPHSPGLTRDLLSVAYAYNMRMFASPTELRLAMQERIANDEGRAKKLVEFVRSDGVRQPLVFWQYSCARDAATTALDAAGIGYQMIDGQHRLSDVDQSRDDPILIQYQAGGAGIELKRSNATVFFENQYSYANLVQAKGRNRRRGGTEPVRRWFLLSDCMFDRDLFELVMRRGELNSDALDELAVRSLPDVEGETL